MLKRRVLINPLEGVGRVGGLQDPLEGVGRVGGLQEQSDNPTATICNQITQILAFMLLIS